MQSVIAVFVLLCVYALTYKHSFWSYSVKIKLSLPLLFAFIILTVFGSMIITYFEFMMQPNNVHFNDEQQHSRKDISQLRGLINIGSVHSSTSSMQTIICRMDKIICSQFNEFSYFPKSTRSRFLALFEENPSKNLLHDSSFLLLSNWSYPIHKILNEYPFDEWLKNWKIDRRIKENEYLQYTLYGKWTAHYLHPPTSLIFAHMAYYKKWSFFLQIREPINRLWSVQQHWHKYDGTKRQIQISAANDVWTKYEKLPLLKRLIFALQNESVSNELIIGLYYRLYFDSLHIQRNDPLNNEFNAIAFELTTSLYFVHIIVWLKQFEKIGFNDDSLFDYFRILQYEQIKKDLFAAKLLIYCWHKEHVESIKDCNVKISDNENMAVFDNNVVSANGHYWSIDMAWKQRLKFMDLFRACNERLDALVAERPRIVLGEWTSYNAMYDEEMKMDHDDSVIVDHPERNTKLSKQKGSKLRKGMNGMEMQKHIQRDRLKYVKKIKRKNYLCRKKGDCG